ncbi:hypothetical protein ACOME3_000403 [Neoechinorhynchus agilis]
MLKLNAKNLICIIRTYKWKIRTRHWDKHHASIRGKLVQKVDLPDFQEIKNRESYSIQERREYMKKEGFPLNPEFNYLPMNLTSSGEIIEKFVCPKEDGLLAPLSGQKLKSFYDKFVSKGSTWRALRKIGDEIRDFDKEYFPLQSQNIYQNAHEALCQWNMEKIRELITEHCYGKLIPPLERKSVVWSLEEPLEPPRIVHARVGDMLSGKIVIGQITVRMFTQQRLAIFDRFGRLLAGNPDELQDILEYIVFERMLSNRYSTWRMHDKIVPDWVKAKSHRSNRTFVLKSAFKKEDVSGEDEHHKVNVKDLTIDS